MEPSKVSAVLFAKNLRRVADFYERALGMTCTHSDGAHAVLDCHGFDLMVQQIPTDIADAIVLGQPVVRRVGSAIRLNFPVKSIEQARAIARSLGGELDDAPPP
jgi:hypothetical protein